ncbi:MAG: SDR family oxidoreductase [Balneolaceae bacterium]|nr:MAG: SDR family oxidoreductase [Balneolaceae bacterium]
MDLNLENKVMAITGGASGIGAAMAERFAAEGAVPVIIDKNSEAGVKLVHRLKEAGHNALLITRELDSYESCKKTVDEILEQTGRIDGLVNNAGTNDSVGLEKGTPEEFFRSLKQNLHHYFFMAQACLPELKRNCGVIVNMSSKTAVTGQGGTSGYSASKGAQLALTREWAVELRESGIRVNAIVPAEVMTPQYEKWLTENFEDPSEKRASIGNRIPLGRRFTTPEEIADVAVFLSSPRASHITGQHIYVDGGYVHLDRALE